MTRTTISTLTLGLTALITGSNSGVPQSAAGPVAVVNVDAVLSVSPAYFTAESLVKKQQAVYETAYNVELDALQGESAKLAQSSLGTSEVAKAASQKRLQAKYDSLQDKRTGYLQKLQDLRDQVMGPIEKRVTDVVEGQRLSLGYSMVINLTTDPNQVISFDKSLNITDKVIEAIKANPITVPTMPGGAGVIPPATPPAAGATRGGGGGGGL